MLACLLLELVQVFWLYFEYIWLYFDYFEYILILCWLYGTRPSLLIDCQWHYLLLQWLQWWKGGTMQAHFLCLNGWIITKGSCKEIIWTFYNDPHCINIVSNWWGWPGKKQKTFTPSLWQTMYQEPLSDFFGWWSQLQKWKWDVRKYERSAHISILQLKMHSALQIR